MSNLFSYTRNWDDILARIPHPLLQKIQIFFYVAYVVFAIATLVYGTYQENERLYMALGGLGIFYAILVKYVPVVLKLVFSLWLHFAVLLMMIGMVLHDTHRGWSKSFIAIGGIFGTLLIISPLIGCKIFNCMGCNNRRDTVSNIRVPEPSVQFRAVSAPS